MRIPTPPAPGGQSAIRLQRLVKIYSNHHQINTPFRNCQCQTQNCISILLLMWLHSLSIFFSYLYPSFSIPFFFPSAKGTNHPGWDFITRKYNFSKKSCPEGTTSVSSTQNGQLDRHKGVTLCHSVSSTGNPYLWVSSNTVGNLVVISY